MKKVAFVPIKLNSQRLPNKNILKMNDKFLCRYILDSLCDVKEIDEIYVYCSNPIIKDYIPETIHFLQRDERLDGEYVKGLDIYNSFMSKVDADIYILAHTTSPFIKAETISNAVKKVEYEGYDSSFSAIKYKTFGWFKDGPLNYSLNDIPRTQDIEPIFIETSGFYIFKKEILEKYNRRIGFKPFVQEVNQIEAIDIDEKSDFDFACLISKNMEA